MRRTSIIDGGRRPVVWSIGLVVAIGLAGWAVGSGGWPGEPSGCIVAGDCSCEAFSSGVVVQPGNTISSLALVLAGLGLMWFAPRGTIGRRHVGFAATVIGLGVGSAAFHASMTEWGGWMDLLGIHLFLGYVLLAELAQLRPRSDRWLFGTLAVCGAAGAVVLWFMDNGLGRYTATALVVGIAVTEWWIARRGLRPDLRWFWAAIGLFSVGLALQVLGRGGGAWCTPDAVLQPHAVWHVVAALGAATLSRHLFPTPESRP
ncbi:MAG: ceramidase domain-containing protein [Acidimicrobiia bacterium]|nr:ceramidase domain-containing protein [Acidimicrobiia bacterium]